MTQDTFVDLVKALRDLGAVEVEAEGFRATFAGPPEPDWDPKELLHIPEEEDHSEVAKQVRRAWELANYGSSG